MKPQLLSRNCNSGPKDGNTTHFSEQSSIVQSSIAQSSIANPLKELNVKAINSKSRASAQLCHAALCQPRATILLNSSNLGTLQSYTPDPAEGRSQPTISETQQHDQVGDVSDERVTSSIKPQLPIPIFSEAALSLPVKECQKRVRRRSRQHFPSACFDNL